MNTFLSVYKKYIYLIIICFCGTFIFLHAEEEEGYELSGGEEGGVNVFLQQAIKESDELKTKAEIFNGARSGVYEGQKLACPYAFERDLFVGSKGEDVRLLQILLNSDRRTLISVSGPGSLGQESDSFGEATKEAVKKFQALFIEYTGVANGRFGPRTRTVMNAICNGANKPSTANNLESRQNRNIYENIFSVQRGAVPGGIATVVGGQSGDKVPPRVSLSANVSAVKVGETFKVILSSSEEIAPITPDSVIVEGGSVKEIRKLSKTSYAITLSAGEDSKKLLVQIEADKIEDLVGNKNENASNEISIKVLAPEKAVADITQIKNTDEQEPTINSLLDKIIASAPQCNYNGSGILITVSPEGKQVNTSGCAPTQNSNNNNSQNNSQTYNCNGQQIPTTQPCQQQTQTVCTTSMNPFTGMPQQQCQQMSPQQAQQAQQALQNQQLGQLLGSLLRNQGFGAGQNGVPGANNVFGGGGGGIPGVPQQLQSAVQAAADKALVDLCEKTNNKTPGCTSEALRQAKERLGQQELSGEVLDRKKWCQDKENQDKVQTNSEATCMEAIKSDHLIDAVKEMNKPCNESYEYYCVWGSNKCFNKKDVLLMSTVQYDTKTNDFKTYLIIKSPDSRNNDLSVSSGQCIVQTPKVLFLKSNGKDNNHYEYKKFSGCSVSENLPDVNDPKKYLPKERAQARIRNITSAYMYIFTSPLKSAACPLKSGQAPNGAPSNVTPNVPSESLPDPSEQDA